MIFLPLRRATILVPSGPSTDPDRLHLHVLVAQMETDWLLVSLSSVPEGFRFDGTTVAAVGEHPFVRQRSYIAYRHARIESQQTLLNGVNSGAFLPREAVPNELFGRICSGFDFSPFCTPYIREFYRQARR